MIEPSEPRTARTDQEIYTVGHADDLVRHMQQRTLVTYAPLLIPYLQPGQRVLDCGCGGGSLTSDLAERVAPGEVVGIDTGVQVLDEARALARRRGVSNIRFEEADVYALPFLDASFDIVFSNSLTSVGHPGGARSATVWPARMGGTSGRVCRRAQVRDPGMEERVS